MTEQPTVRTKTGRLMAALSAAEHLTAASPIPPATVGTAEFLAWGTEPGTHESVIGVALHFHNSPDGVRQFAARFGAEVREELRSEGADVYVFADGWWGDVRFRAWVLMAVESSAVAA